MRKIIHHLKIKIISFILICQYKNKTKNIKKYWLYFLHFQVNCKKKLNVQPLTTNNYLLVKCFPLKTHFID